LVYSEYAFITHRITGVIRIEKGPAKVVLVPFEEYITLDGKIVQQALTADANNCIHIRDIVSGIEELITKPQLFFPPTPNVKVLGKEPLFKLAPYEKMVIMDRESNIIFKNGDKEQGFFLPPFCKIVSQMWTVGLEKEKIKVEIFDCRFHDMDFSFSVRTNDNVEIKMHINVYWQIKDFEKMIKSTSDPPEDICNQIRSQILNMVSKMATREIMEYSSLALVKDLHEEDSEFFTQRGIQIVRVNITEKMCANPEVDKTYRAVIEQKIIRVKNVEEQRGVNDKRIAEIEGQIMAETENLKLLEKKMANVNMEQSNVGRSDGERLRNFFDGLGKDIPIQEKMKIFLEIQRSERMKMITEKVDNLYLTPENIDFQFHKIENGDNDTKVNLNLDSRKK